ncbi:MAG: NAD(P)-binding domain-containing protein [Solirubrobacteraceae bacterium]|nr:NAD(P)-binding domain-containing protein [Solirubrobacteraceae bacterium]
MTAASRPSVLVIGAGSAGIAALKTLRDRGLDAVAVEAADRLGGRWVNKDPELGPVAYRTLHSNTSRDALAYADFPAPRHLPVFPSAVQVGEYCEHYVDAFGLRDRIQLGERVVTTTRKPGGGWTVETTNGTREVGALVVATGPFGKPRLPEPALPGLSSFGGEVLHVHDYQGPSQLKGKRVVVVGVGTSAVDLACDAAEHADVALHSMRRGAWFLPEILFGRPADRYRPPVPLSWKARRALFARAAAAQLGPLATYGIAHPGHGYGEVHPLRSGRLLSHLAHGNVATRPALAGYTANGVEYVDGRSDDADMVLFCTGWLVEHPFLPEELRGDGAGPPLLARIFHPDAPDLAFAGLIDAGTVAMPLAEAQGRVIADHLCGDYHPVPVSERADQVALEEAISRERYPAARRVRLQVDPVDYPVALEKERRAGHLRARAAGHTLPV